MTMCLLTFMQEGTTASDTDLRVGADNNPDGFGWAIHAGSTVLRGHGMVFEQVLDEFMKQRNKHSGPALFHSRITTHGGTNKANCHPFQIGRDKHSVLAHNGMLPLEEQNGRSDTRVFAEDILPASGGTPILDSKKMRKKISKFAEGSKLVILTANKNNKNPYYIINENLGHWVNGVWWSNSSYKWTRTYSNVGYGMYASGWQPSTKTVSKTEPEQTYHFHEEWSCNFCGHVEQVDEYNIDDTLSCPKCFTCYYCEMSALSGDCDCFPDEMRSYEPQDYVWSSTHGCYLPKWDDEDDLEFGYSRAV